MADNDQDMSLWGTESGFPSNYMGTVTEAWFGVNNKYNANATLLFLKLETDDDMMPEIEEQFSVGDGWKTWDGGETIEHPDQVRNERKKINSNSQYGKFQDKVRTLGALEAIAENAIQKGIKKGPFNSQSWVGTQWHFAEVVNTYTDRETKEVKTSRKNYPDEWLGFAQEGAAPVRSARNGSGAATAAATASTVTSTVPGPDRSTLAEMARTMPHEAWVDAVMELPGALQDSSLISQLPDPNGLYNALKVEVLSMSGATATAETDPT